MVQMIAHQVARHAPQRFLYAGDLRNDIRAVAALLHHFLQAANLPLDSTQAMMVRRFDIRIDTDGLACLVRIARTAPAGPVRRPQRGCLFNSVLRLSSHKALLKPVIPPTPMYVKSGPVNVESGRG